MTLINMFVFHTNKDNALSLETFGFYGIDPEASLEEFFRLNSLMTGQYEITIDIYTLI